MEVWAGARCAGGLALPHAPHRTYAYRDPGATRSSIRSCCLCSLVRNGHGGVCRVGILDQGGGFLLNNFPPGNAQACSGRWYSLWAGQETHHFRAQTAVKRQKRPFVFGLRSLSPLVGSPPRPHTTRLPSVLSARAPLSSEVARAVCERTAASALFLTISRAFIAYGGGKKKKKALPRGVRCALLGADAGRVLIGACNPPLRPNRGVRCGRASWSRRSSPRRRRPSSGSGSRGPTLW